MKTPNETTNTVIRKTYPRIRTYDKHGKTYFRVDMRRKGYVGQKFKDFSTADAAKSFASAVVGDGIPVLNSTMLLNNQEVAYLEQHCGVYGKTLKDAVVFATGVWAKEKENGSSPFVSELLTLWIDYKKTGVKKLRKKSISTMSNCANVLKKHFGQMRVLEVTEDIIENFLIHRTDKKGNRISITTQKYYARYLQNFFNWCIRKKHCVENPANHWVKEIQIPKTTVAFYTVEQCQKIMMEALAVKEMTAYYALGLFAGIRPDEISNMTWAKNIKMDTKEIFIEAAISKTKMDRQFKITDTMFKWLEHCKAYCNAENQPLIPSDGLRYKKDKVNNSLGFDNIQDGLRHTFATYFYAEVKNYEALKNIMGNSPDIIRRHYKGTIDAAEIEKFKNIVPSSLTK